MEFTIIHGRHGMEESGMIRLISQISRKIERFDWITLIIGSFFLIRSPFNYTDSNIRLFFLVPVLNLM